MTIATTEGTDGSDSLKYIWIAAEIGSSQYTFHCLIKFSDLKQLVLQWHHSDYLFV